MRQPVGVASSEGECGEPCRVRLKKKKMPGSLQLCSMDGGACVSGTWPDQRAARLDVIAGGSVNGAIIDQRCVATRSVLSELGGEPAGPERCPISSFTAILNGPARCVSTGVVAIPHPSTSSAQSDSVASQNIPVGGATARLPRDL